MSTQELAVGCWPRRRPDPRQTRQESSFLSPPRPAGRRRNSSVLQTRGTATVHLSTEGMLAPLLRLARPASPVSSASDQADETSGALSYKLQWNRREKGEEGNEPLVSCFLVLWFRVPFPEWCHKDERNMGVFLSLSVVVIKWQWLRQ
jgi:hypothetical protein